MMQIAVDLLNLVNTFEFKYEDLRELIISECKTLLEQEGLRGDLICEGFLDINTQMVGSYSIRGNFICKGFLEINAEIVGAYCISRNFIMYMVSGNGCSDGRQYLF